ncbi:BZ3500_MvSof-1268-A1-R1_Chr4-2g06875 [Microbotryum saponariae]|uniref:BZ3500_MvSof-1268-A1-R1_Chr4-2g06875 protein n=1 Tax=Microbotryum saponariae TaxID=289078 RepID=A0A2X0MRH0_9BASI|nr:BZ3500_MvSof-1268-A1-R1_Chr4-2g06875 [Microbotryum saponariae]SDA06540.1 BZ3501_MvSof-1269-A2-R1_Chr4-2g06586 [Microbotryum saponariae]
MITSKGLLLADLIVGYCESADEWRPSSPSSPLSLSLLTEVRLIDSASPFKTSDAPRLFSCPTMLDLILSNSSFNLACFSLSNSISRFRFSILRLVKGVDGATGDAIATATQGSRGSD